MKLHCHDYRFLTEPLRIFSHWKALNVQESFDKTTFAVPTLEASGRFVTGFWEILDALAEAALENKSLTKDELELYRKLRSSYDEILKTVSVIYEKLISLDDWDVNQPKIIQNIKELELIHASTNFFGSDEATAIDLYLYDFYKAVDRLYSKLIPAEIFRYIDRLEVKGWMKTYNSIDKNFGRDFSPSVSSLANKIESTFGDKIAQLNDFAMMNGLLFKKKVETLEGMDLMVPIPIPFSLYPKKILREDFDKLVRIQDRWNIILNQMARDYCWYKEKLQGVIEADEFVRRNFEIKEKSFSYPKIQDKQLCIFRNDYMYHAEQNRWMQVEYNCIAVGLGPTSDRVHKFHKKLVGTYLGEEIPDLPTNDDLVSNALYEAFKLYGNTQAKVLFVVKDVESNIFDQRYLEQSLFEKGVTVIRRTLKQVYQEHTFDTETGKIYIKNDEIALVYYRTGYTAEDYTSEDEWLAREALEFSQAIKCPSIDFFLINFKIFQLFFASDVNELKRFVEDSRELETIKSTFAEFYSIETPEQLKKIIEMVRESPDKFVLKPQLEGGGHNFYGNNILSKLEKLTSTEAKGYLLMQKIESNPSLGFLVRNGKMDMTPINSEIGIFGYVISDKSRIIKSGTGGALLRSKVNEGGIMSGAGVVDSVYLQ